MAFRISECPASCIFATIGIESSCCSIARQPMLAPMVTMQIAYSQIATLNAYHLQSSGAKILTTVRKANVVTRLAAFIDAPAIEAAVYTPSTATRDTTDT